MKPHIILFAIMIVVFFIVGCAANETQTQPTSNIEQNQTQGSTTVQINETNVATENNAMEEKTPEEVTVGKNKIYGTVKLQSCSIKSSTICRVSLFQTTIMATKPMASQTSFRYKIDDSQIIAKTTSGADGAYELSVLDGDYSIFILDNTTWYCSKSTSDIACPITVNGSDIMSDFQVSRKTY